MFLIYILVYVFFAYIMYSLGKKTNNSRGNPYRIDNKLWWYIISFTLICALRGNTGVDTLSYVYKFKHGVYGANLTSVNDELAFYCLCNFLSNNSIHYTVGLGVCAFLQIFFIVKGVLPHKSLLIYFPIVLFGSELFLGMANAVRQMIAASLFFYAVQFIVSRNPIKYLFCIMCASLFHHSALMLLILYFIPRKFDVSDQRIPMMIVYMACVIIGSSPQFQSLISSLQLMVASTGYSRYVDTVSEILDEHYIREVRRMGLMQLSYLSSGFFVIWFGPHIREKYRESIPEFRLWYLFAVIYICLYFLVCNVSHLLIRPIMYFLLFKAIILSLILMEFIKCRKRNVLYRHLTIIFILIIWANIAWDIIKNWEFPYETVTYKFFFI